MQYVQASLPAIGDMLGIRWFRKIKPHLLLHLAACADEFRTKRTTDTASGEVQFKQITPWGSRQITGVNPVTRLADNLAMREVLAAAHAGAAGAPGFILASPPTTLESWLERNVANQPARGCASPARPS